MSRWSVAIVDDNERMVEILDGILRQDEELQIVGIAISISVLFAIAAPP